MRSAYKTILLALLFGSLLLSPAHAAAQDEYFTIIAGSYRSLANAEYDYKALKQSMINDLLGTLRIEKNGQYFTVRLGKFSQKSLAYPALLEVRQKFKDARLLSAYFKPERFIKILSKTANISLSAQAVVSENHEKTEQGAGDVGINSSSVQKKVLTKVQQIDGPTLKIDPYSKTTVIAGDLLDELQNKEFYTLQTGSFTTREQAWQEFDRLRHKKNIPLAWLRLEKIQDFYTVRLGKFGDKNSALGLWQSLRKQMPVKLLQAYIKPARIIKIWGARSEITPADSSSAKPTSAEVVDHTVIDATESAVSPPPKVKLLVSRKHKVKIIGRISELAQTIEQSNGGEEFFTVQAASFTDPKLAVLAYKRLRKSFSMEQLPDLRIEVVHGYHTVRMGKCANRQEAVDLAAAIKNAYPHLVILQAYIIDSRIVKEDWGDNKEGGQKVQKIVTKLADVAPDSVQTAGTAEPLDSSSYSESDLEDNAAPDNGVEAKPAAVLPIIAKNKTVELPPSQGQEQKAIPVEPETVKNIKSEKMIVAKATSDVKNANNDVLKGVFDDEIKKQKFSYEVVKVIENDDQGEKIKMPSALFFDRQRDEIYVINGVNNRIIVYGSDFFPQNSLGKGRGIDSPMGGYIAPGGRIYITQAGVSGSAPRLTILNNAYMPVKEIMMTDMPDNDGFIPQKITLANDRIYITGLHSKKILILKSSGAFEKWFQVAIDKRGEYAFTDMNGPRETTYIRDAKADLLGNLFFLSEETSKIYVFNYKENFLFSFGIKGGAEGKMSRPRSLAIDEKRHCFYVVDYMRHTVLIYDFNGKFRYEFGGRGWGAEWFNYPADIELGAQGQVIVADFFNQQVKVVATHWQDSFPIRDPKLWQLVDEDKP